MKVSLSKQYKPTKGVVQKSQTRTKPHTHPPQDAMTEAEVLNLFAGLPVKEHEHPSYEKDYDYAKFTYTSGKLTHIDFTKSDAPVKEIDLTWSGDLVIQVIKTYQTGQVETIDLSYIGSDIDELTRTLT